MILKNKKMRFLNKITFLFTALLMPFIANAYSFTVDGIYYNIYGNYVTVTYKGSNYLQYKSYSGDVEIPATVNYNGKTYIVNEIGHSAFSECDELKSITIPATITKIDKYAFSRCYGLETINYNAISCEDFRLVWGYDSLNVTTINVGNSVQRIPKDFANGRLPKLSNVIIGNSVSVIGQCAFGYCKGLTEITIPNSVIEIEEAVFLECRGLKNIRIPNSVNQLGKNAFRSCTSLVSVTLPESLTSISDGLFSNCTALGSFDIPNGVTSIGSDAFLRCTNLTDVTIPSSVTEIKSFAFYDCSALEKVYSYINDISNVTIVSDWTFWIANNDYSNRTLFVRPGLVEAYQNSSYWFPYFGHIVEMCELIGDVDSSNDVNINDVTALIDFLLTGNNSLISINTADIDGNGSINISDVTTLIDILLTR